MIYKMGEWYHKYRSVYINDVMKEWLSENIGKPTSHYHGGHYTQIETNSEFNRMLTQLMLLSGDDNLFSMHPDVLANDIEYFGHPQYQAFHLKTRYIDGFWDSFVFMAIRDELLAVQMKLQGIETFTDLIEKW